ncbi:MAG: GspH/FimT family pseudopilin [Sphingomonadales bacterium]
MNDHHRHRAGFTLVELLVVLAIMMLILTAAPTLYSAAVSGAQVKQNAARLAADLRFLRNTAVVSGREMEARLHPADRHYAISRDARIRQLSDGVFMSFREPGHQPGGGESTHGAATIRFFPDGSSSGGRVVLSKDGRTREITVSWLTGKISIGR